MEQPLSLTLRYATRRELLDGAVRLYRRHFWTLVRRMLLGSLPLLLFVLLSGGWAVLAVSASGLSPLRAELLLTAVNMLAQGTSPRIVWDVVGQSLVLDLFVKLLLTDLVLALLLRLALGEASEALPPLRSGWGGLALLALPLLAALPFASLATAIADLIVGGAWLVVMSLQAPALLPRVLGPFLLARAPGMCASLLCAFGASRLVLALPVALLEGHGPRAAFRRSWQLTRGAWRTIGLSLLLTYGLAGLLSALPEIGAALIVHGGDGEIGGLVQILTWLGGGLLDLLIVPLPLAVLALIYLDRRARVDGLDLELAARMRTRAEVAALAADAAARRAAGDVVGALAAYDQALLLDPNDIVLVCERLGARLQAGELDGALADAERTLTLAPNDPVALHNRGLVRHLRGELAFAHADYDLALVMRPHYADEIWGYANSHYERGNLRVARVELEQVLRLVPQHAPAHYLLACVAMREQHQDEAAQLLGKAIALDASMAEHARADELLAPLLARMPH